MLSLGGLFKKCFRKIIIPCIKSQKNVTEIRLGKLD